MLTKNISFKNFSGVKIKKSIFVKKTFFDKNKLIQNYPLLKSFFKDYNYSYKKNDLKKFKNSLICLTVSTLKAPVPCSEI